jgi:hypothetical protein
VTPAQRCAPLLDILRQPAQMAQLDLKNWDLLIRQAASAGLLSRIAILADTLNLNAQLPSPVRPHLTAARTLAAKQRQAVRWEARRVAHALSKLTGPVLLLKGAAYAMADLPPAAGRLFGDIDILVPHDQLGQAESALMLAGWHTQKQDEYDQRYYRRWMHELPPMTHIRRGTVLDVHHNLLPETARIRTHAGPILTASQALTDPVGLSIPSHADLVLHSACHLFHEGEWGHGLRDLVDLDAMLRTFANTADFWPSLLLRASRLNLGRPLYYALDTCQRWLLTPIPFQILSECPSPPPKWQRRLMRILFDAGLASTHRSCQGPLSHLVKLILYVRGHYLRMPWRLLIPHLLHQVKRGKTRQNARIHS